MQHLNLQVIDADTFARLFREFPKVFETFSFDEKRNLILLLVKEVIYTPKRIKVLFWGDLPEMILPPVYRPKGTMFPFGGKTGSRMNLDLKNPPDWTPPPDEGGPYTPKGLGPSGCRGTHAASAAGSHESVKWLPEDDAYQTFLEDEFTFEIQLVTKGQKRLIPCHAAS